MDLPGRLNGLIQLIKTGTAVEDALLQLHVKQLSQSLSALDKHFGRDCGWGIYQKLLLCLKTTRETACYDRYEAEVQGAITRRRTRSELEKQLVSELVGRIMDITDMLIDLAGITLVGAGSPESSSGPVDENPDTKAPGS